MINPIKNCISFSNIQKTKIFILFIKLSDLHDNLNRQGFLYLPYNLCNNLNPKLSENKSQKERKEE